MVPVKLSLLRVPNSNRKVVNLFDAHTGHNNLLCVLGKDTYAIAAQWIRTQVGNRKVVDFRFSSKTGQCIIVFLGKTHYSYTSIMRPSNLSIVVVQSE